jgi:hypothetical protein
MGEDPGRKLGTLASRMLPGAYASLPCIHAVEISRTRGILTVRCGIETSSPHCTAENQWQYEDLQLVVPSTSCFLASVWCASCLQLFETLIRPLIQSSDPYSQFEAPGALGRRTPVEALPALALYTVPSERFCSPVSITASSRFESGPSITVLAGVAAAPALYKLQGEARPSVTRAQQRRANVYIKG